MPAATHKIKGYRIHFGSQVGGPSLVFLECEDNAIGNINFVADAAPIPAPVIPNVNQAALHLRRSAYAGLIDMLRNESPVYLTIELGVVSRVFIHTDSELVGEGER